jgi:hypothetical protein
MAPGAVDVLPDSASVERQVTASLPYLVMVLLCAGS